MARSQQFAYATWLGFPKAQRQSLPYGASPACRHIITPSLVLPRGWRGTVDWKRKTRCTQRPDGQCRRRHCCLSGPLRNLSSAQRARTGTCTGLMTANRTRIAFWASANPNASRLSSHPGVWGVARRTAISTANPSRGVIWTNERLTCLVRPSIVREIVLPIRTPADPAIISTSCTYHPSLLSSLPMNSLGPGQARRRGGAVAQLTAELRHRPRRFHSLWWGRSRSSVGP